MPETLPADLEEFVRQELGRGVFESRDDLFVEALRVFKDLRSRQEALRGEAVEVDVEDVIAAGLERAARRKGA